MRVRGRSLGAMCGLAAVLSVIPCGAADLLADLQARFDRETNGVHKAKMMGALGDAQFEEARRAGKAGDHGTVALTLEKYRDNVRAALDALKKQHPDAERNSNGYRQLQVHVHRGIREVEESLLAAPEPFKPPLEIVHEDLIAMDDELLKLLFPRRPLNTPAVHASPEKQP
jgi:hypothetical protein